MKITKIQTFRNQRPACCIKVKVSKTPTMTSIHREQMARRTGREPDQCPTVSDFMVDGRPMCRAHAGVAALEHLLGQRA